MEVTKEIQKMHDAQEKMSKATETAKAKLTAEMENNQTLAYRIDKLKETVEEVLTSDNRSYETYKKNLQNLNGDKETSDGEIFHLIGLIKEYETKAGEIKTNIYNLFYQQAHAHIRMRNVTHYYPKEQQLKDDAIADIDDMKKTGKQYGIDFVCNSESLIPSSLTAEQLFGTRKREVSPAVEQKAEPMIKEFELPKTIQAGVTKIKEIISPKTEPIAAGMTPGKIPH